MSEQTTDAELALPSTPGSQPTVEAGRAARAGLLRRAVSEPALALSVLVLTVAVLWAFVPGLFTNVDPLRVGVGGSFEAPSLSHPFGTDQLGRDLLSRTIYGTSETAKATILAVLLGLVIGSVLGVLSGLARGIVDVVIMQAVAVLLSIPGLLLAMAVVAALGYGTVNIAIAVGISTIAPFTRVMRAEVIRVASMDYISASYGSGAGFLRTAWHHVLPNSAPTVLALATLECGTALLAVASLGFLGFGAPPPQPEWGLAVAEGRNYLSLYPWISLLPGAVIIVVVVAANRVSKSVAR
jgi:peptide/nickel transport system permease protein